MTTPSDKQTQPALQPPELLPCPFCGSDAVLRYEGLAIDAAFDGPLYGQINCSEGELRCCPKLQFEPTEEAEREAITEWNTRRAVIATGWTDNFPVIEGTFYWTRHKQDHKDVDVGQLKEQTLYFTDGSQRSRSPRRDFEYLGPVIPEKQATTVNGISWSALLDVLERLRSKNRNPANEWYHGWNAAIQCLINDINSRVRVVDGVAGEDLAWTIIRQFQSKTAGALSPDLCNVLAEILTASHVVDGVVATVDAYEVAQKVITDWHDVEKWHDPSMTPIPPFTGAQEQELARLIAEAIVAATAPIAAPVEEEK